MNEADQAFLQDMATCLDETIKNLVLEERELSAKIGATRVAELREFWQQQLSADEETEFRRSLDYWDKILIYLWARSKRAHHSRAQVGQTFMKLAAKSKKN